jgi:alpha-glucosidase
MLLLTLRGTPTLYYGDELGMHNVPIPPDRIQDPFEKNVPGLGLGRDPSRTPMQWSATHRTGFTTGEPWLPVSADWQSINVEVESNDSRSLLNLYRRLIELRRHEPALSIGAYNAVPAQSDILAYRRQWDDGRRFLIVLNLSHEVASFQSLVAPSGRIALSTHLDREEEAFEGQLKVRGDEGLIIDI